MDTKEKTPTIHRITNKDYPSELPPVIKTILNNTLWENEVALGFNGLYVDNENRQYDIFFHGCEGWMVNELSYITKYRLVIVGIDKGDSYFDISEFDQRMNTGLHTIMQYLYDCKDANNFPVIIKDSRKHITAGKYGTSGSYGVKK